MSLHELAIHLNGYGRAQLTWDCYRYGIDPILYHHHHNPNSDTMMRSSSPMPSSDPVDAINITTTNTTTSTSMTNQWKFPSRRRNQTLGLDALERISNLYNQCYHNNNNNSTSSNTTAAVTTGLLLHPPTLSLDRIDNRIATLTHVSQSSDGTTKLLLTLCRDQTQIETVLIPFYNNNNNNNNNNTTSTPTAETVDHSTPDTNGTTNPNTGGRTTICISSQVGCQQGCTFCATGTMGKTRSLSSDEIIVQYFYAQQLIYQNHPNQNHPHGNAIKRTIPPITNVGTYLLKIFVLE